MMHDCYFCALYIKGLDQIYETNRNKILGVVKYYNDENCFKLDNTFCCQVFNWSVKKMQSCFFCWYACFAAFMENILYYLNIEIKSVNFLKSALCLFWGQRVIPR